jgi:DNA-binding NarL/FixJ family response regulator
MARLTGWITPAKIDRCEVIELVRSLVTLDRKGDMPIKVLIADDHPVLRYGLTAYLDRQADMQVVGEADSGDTVLPEVERSRPDVLLLDINMPGMAAGQILEALPDLENPPEVLIFSAYSDPDKVVGLVRAGARGYLLKNTSPDQILEGVRAVACGQAWFSPAARVALAEAANRGILILKGL